jgi:Large-conductance mechanosensitive channel, MscL
MLKGFRQFILRGNVLDLAVAVVIGAAFGAVVTAFVTNILTPLIAAIVGKPDFSAFNFSVNGAVISYGVFSERIDCVPAGGGGGLLLSDRADECLEGPRRAQRHSCRSHQQKMPGMPERNSHCRATLRILYLSGIHANGAR